MTETGGFLQDVYVLVFNGFADWEPADALAELRRSGKRHVRAVGFDEDTVTSMGGLRVVPDMALSNVEYDQVGLLLLPGGDMWEAGSSPEDALVALIEELISRKTPIAAICGATFALGRAGLLNDRRHTSTVPGDLAAIGPAYRGAEHYTSSLAVSDRGVITASGLGSIEFAREIFSALLVFSEGEEETWFDMYRHGRLPNSAVQQRAPAADRSVAE
jgi:putative intracellular protease/amidase